MFVLAGPDLAEEQRVDVDVDAIQLEKGDRATRFQPRTGLEFAIEPSQPAGIFIEGESNALTLRLCNHMATPATVAVNFQTTDYADKPAWLESVLVYAPPKTPIQRDLLLPVDWKGYYRICATAKTARKAERSELRIAIVPRPAAGDSVCGINHAFVSADQIRLASKAGVTWYRDWSLKWQHIEPAKGEFHWELGDRQIDRVLREAVRVLPLLPPFPSADWNSDAPASLAIGKSYPDIRLRASFAPKDPKELAEFVGKAVRRYKDRIHFWEFLNEPVYTSYALPAKLGGKGYTPADYVALLAVAAKGMRDADPACKVMGGIAGPPATRTREVIEAGCLKHVDIFNLHVYPDKRPPESYEQRDERPAGADGSARRRQADLDDGVLVLRRRQPAAAALFPRERLGRGAAVGQRASVRRLHGAVLPDDALARGGEGVPALRRQRPSERPELRMRPVRLRERPAETVCGVGGHDGPARARPAPLGSHRSAMAAVRRRSRPASGRWSPCGAKATNLARASSFRSQRAWSLSTSSAGSCPAALCACPARRFISWARQATRRIC